MQRNVLVFKLWLKIDHVFIMELKLTIANKQWNKIYVCVYRKEIGQLA